MDRQDSHTSSFEISVPGSVPAAICILGILVFCGFVVYRVGNNNHETALRKLELEHKQSLVPKDGEALTQNGGKLGSVQQGNVSYFYQVDPTNGLRIPLPDHKVMLNAFETSARVVGPVVSIAPEITLYNGKMAYMGMWVTFMQKPPESLPR